MSDKKKRHSVSFFITLGLAQNTGLKGILMKFEREDFEEKEL